MCDLSYTAWQNTIAPLWNRNTPASTFDMYTSPTMDTSPPGQPNNISLACLGCHDGVSTDIGDVINAPGSGLGNGVGCKNCHTGFTFALGESSAWPHILSTDLTNDHPISINYPTPAEDDKFIQPTQSGNRWYAVSGNAQLPLYGSNKYVECSTCHNVHDPAEEPFLRAANTGSALCTTCHDK